MKISELLAEEQRDKYCSDKCCGSDVKAEDCKCPPTCKHCNCNAKNIDETTTAGGIASSMGAGNGFVNGGPGTVSRVSKKRKKKSSSN